LTFAQLDSLTRRYGEEKEWLDFRTGLICSVIANVNRDPKKKSSPFKPQDFMPRSGKKNSRPYNAAELQERIEHIMFVAGGRKEVKKDGQ
jgi:hypothetical protein